VPPELGGEPGGDASRASASFARPYRVVINASTATRTTVDRNPAVTLRSRVQVESLFSSGPRWAVVRLDGWPHCHQRSVSLGWRGDA
jgi:hypothetical protein